MTTEELARHVERIYQEAEKLVHVEVSKLFPEDTDDHGRKRYLVMGRIISGLYGHHTRMSLGVFSEKLDKLSEHVDEAI